ncbi:MAG: right-handed parallel beta-helix repeat-containing protein [Planctomycetota bacterium]|nr:MAG: right-handed parallel beta-helix repeat-containing protein [Planctomycetota bacterium]
MRNTYTLRRWAWVCLIVIPALGGGEAPTASARDIYVNNRTGDDHFLGRQPTDGTGYAGPVRTIEKALSLAQSGDRIVIAATGVPYRESLTLATARLSGNAVREFVIEGNGAVLDGTVAVPRDAWELYTPAWRGEQKVVFRCWPPLKGTQILYIDEKPGLRVPADSAAERPPVLEPMQWCYHRGALYVGLPENARPEQYDLRYAGMRTGLTLHHVSKVVIRDLVVQGFQTDGIAVANSVKELRLERVVCRGNGRAGISVGAASRVEIVDSLLGDNGEAQLITHPTSTTVVRNTQIIGNTAPAVVRKGGTLQIDGQPVESLEIADVEPPSENTTNQQ